jgi:hypothetical protein
MSIAEVQARIAAIQQMFAPPAPRPPAPAADGFADLLDSVQGVGRSGALRHGRAVARDAPPNAAEHAQFAHDLLGALRMPDTPENVRAVTAWAAAEGTRAANNPLATTHSMPGATSFNSVGVKNYSSYWEGIAATVATLRNGRYDAVLAALSRGDDAVAVGRAVAASPWGTGTGVLRRLGAA